MIAYLLAALWFSHPGNSNSKQNKPMGTTDVQLHTPTSVIDLSANHRTRKIDRNGIIAGTGKQEHNWLSIQYYPCGLFVTEDEEPISKSTPWFGCNLCGDWIVSTLPVYYSVEFGVGNLLEIWYWSFCTSTIKHNDLIAQHKMVNWLSIQNCIFLVDCLWLKMKKCCLLIVQII